MQLNRECHWKCFFSAKDESYFRAQPWKESSSVIKLSVVLVKCKISGWIEQETRAKKTKNKQNKTSCWSDEANFVSTVKFTQFKSLSLFLSRLKQRSSDFVPFDLLNLDVFKYKVYVYIENTCTKHCTLRTRSWIVFCIKSTSLLRN